MDIERLGSPPTDSCLERIIEENLPVVMPTPGWDGSGAARWTLESLEGRFSDLVLPIHYADGVRFAETGEQFHNATVSLEASRYFEYLKGSSEFRRHLATVMNPALAARVSLYLQVSLRDGEGDDAHARLGRALLQDLPPLALYASGGSSPDLFVALWIGAGGNITSCHRDGPHNLLSVIHGEKHLVLFSPDQADCLYEELHVARDGEPDESIYACSPVRVDDPDLERFPKFRDARPLSATVRRGESLFLPSNWFHQVRSEGLNIAVSRWWSPDGVASDRAA
ncbi:MAG: cupin-like domain-containing protein [Polyangiaceae bacterium]